MNTVHVLVVEDDPDNLALIAAILNQYDVSGCGSSDEALMTLETFSPDLVVLDIGMQPVDGLECLKAIRLRPECSGIPAIALTGFARDADKEAFLAAGFQAVVTKPIHHRRDLEDIVEKLLNQRCASAS